MSVPWRWSGFSLAYKHLHHLYHSAVNSGCTGDSDPRFAYDCVDLACLPSLEHPIRVGRLFRDVLADIPVLDDFAVLKLEDVDDRGPQRVRLPFVVDVQDHEVAISEGALDVAVIAGRLVAQEGKKGLETLRPVGGVGIVLDVAWSEIGGCGFEILLVYRLLVEFKHRLLVCFHLCGVGGKRGRGGEACGKG